MVRPAFFWGTASSFAYTIIDHCIAHDSYRINIKNIDTEHDISMREVYGLDKTLRGSTRISGFLSAGLAVLPHKNIHLLHKSQRVIQLKY